jgi:peptide/nickel transport system substrate-binding protein
MGNWYVGHGTPEHKENRPGYDPDLPWVSSSPDINSPEWERARKVREALFIAVDRQLIADTILGGQGEPLVMWGWESNVDKLDPVLKKGWEFNPDRAKQLLEEAGYADGFEITIVASIRDTPGEVEACEAVASMWRT